MTTIPPICEKLREYGSDAHMVTPDKGFILEASETIIALVSALEAIKQFECDEGDEAGALLAIKLRARATLSTTMGQDK